MPKKNATPDFVWFEIRLEKPLRLEIDGDLVELLPGKKKTITNNVELVREAQRLGAEVKVLSEEILEEIGDIMELSRKGFQVISKISKAIQGVKKEPKPKKTEPKEPEQIREPESEKQTPQQPIAKQEENKPETKAQELKKLLGVDISSLSEEEKAKLRELIGTGE